MTKEYVNKFGKTNIAVVSGDITRIPADAIITAINSAGMWFGGIDGAIQRVAGHHYHAQASANMPLKNLQTVIARSGVRPDRKIGFRDVVFVVDDLESPLDDVLYYGLKASHNEHYKSVLVPTMRMGVMAGVHESPEEAIQKMCKGTYRFVNDYADVTKLEDISFVVYNDETTQKNWLVV